MIKMGLITLNEPYSMVSESYKIFRTNLNYMCIDRENRVILFTSTTAEEGKTISIANTAISLAKEGKRVLLIDCDLRRANIHMVFGVSQEPGLTNVLVNKNLLSEVVQTVSDINGLHLLTSGSLPPDPSEMLSSQTFQMFLESAKLEYDMILIDAPPVLNITDATVLSRFVDGVVLIIAMKETKMYAAKEAKMVLNKVGANILGVLITKSEVKNNKAYNYYYGPEKKKRFNRKVVS